MQSTSFFRDPSRGWKLTEFLADVSVDAYGVRRLASLPVRIRNIHLYIHYIRLHTYVHMYICIVHTFEYKSCTPRTRDLWPLCDLGSARSPKPKKRLDSGDRALSFWPKHPTHNASGRLEGDVTHWRPVFSSCAFQLGLGFLGSHYTLPPQMPVCTWL